MIRPNNSNNISLPKPGKASAESRGKLGGLSSLKNSVGKRESSAALRKLSSKNNNPQSEIVIEDQAGV